MASKGEISNLKAWLFVLIALLDDIIILALIYLLLRLFGVKIPLSVSIAGGLVLGILIFFIHKAVLPSLRRRQVTGSEGMIGRAGRVTQPLIPRGVIKINEEYWQAKSTSGDMNIGEEVEIVGINRLVLEVKRKIP